MPSPAAQYLRMSTEHQQYSLANQSVAINRYAIQHGFAVVQTYQDEGRSGLVLRERPGLKQLLEDVVSGQSRFRAILVYDVSRWGRFQDIDEAAHYEFMCKSMGVPVHYCAETFGIDTSMVNGIMKALKRTMASEYSRELSEKVSAGARRLVNLGYKQGGMAGYGFRRLLISADGTPKQILAPGQRKSLATDRVILTHGPAQELKCVREIYRLVVDERRTPTYIARELNRRHIPYLNGTLWYQEAVTRILTHPKYKGYVVYGQRDQKLHKRSTSVPKERWLMAKGRHQPIVSPEVFEQAQSILGQRTHYMTNEQLLDGVRHLWAKHGRLSLRAIDDSPDLPSNRVYVQRFGSFWNVCKLVGYEGKGSIFLRAKARILHHDMRRELMQNIVEQNLSAVQIERCGRRKDRLRLFTGRTVAVVLCRCSPNASGQLRWTISRSPYENRRVTLLALLTPQNNRIHSLHLSTGIIRLDATLWEGSFREFGLSTVTVVTNFVEQVRRVLSLSSPKR